ncbi:MAG: hypothetical protein ACPLXS_01165 [Candidatus Micrarchaeales archaeon]
MEKEIIKNKTLTFIITDNSIEGKALEKDEKESVKRVLSSYSISSVTFLSHLEHKEIIVTFNEGKSTKALENFRPKLRGMNEGKEKLFVLQKNLLLNKKQKIENDIKDFLTKKEIIIINEGKYYIQLSPSNDFNKIENLLNNFVGISFTLERFYSELVAQTPN